MSMNINVAVRIRPLNKKEIKRGDSKPWRYDNSSIYQYDEEQNKPIGNQYFFGKYIYIINSYICILIIYY